MRKQGKINTLMSGTVIDLVSAPNANARLISYFHPAEPFSSQKSKARVANMIMKAAAALSLGDVLLLEVQFEGKVNATNTLVPVETDPAVFEAIRLSTRLGIIVVEAAGNGNANLDFFTDLITDQIGVMPDFQKIIANEYI